MRHFICVLLISFCSTFSAKVSAILIGGVEFPRELLYLLMQLVILYQVRRLQLYPIQEPRMSLVYLILLVRQVAQNKYLVPFFH